MVRNLFALLCLQNRFEPVHDWLVTNAHRLDEATLKSITGFIEDDVRSDESLATAVQSLGENGRQFEAFARSFLEAIQDPDADADTLDQAEVDRLRRALTLTRVTAVGDEAAPTLHNDPQFRWQNRELMKRLRDHIDGEAALGIAPSKVSQPHSESGAYLVRKLDRGGWFELWLYHEETGAQLSIVAGAKRMKSAEEILRTSLAPIAPMLDDSHPGRLVLWRHGFDSALDLDAREEVIREEALPLFGAASGALAGCLE